MSRIQRALLSVTDKSGLVDFANKLVVMGVELISTGGTAKLLRDSGVPVKDISELTGFPEMLDGRVKTLHPKVHGGILHIRSNKAHLSAVAEHGIQPIDMVVVNLYAFEKTASKPGVHFEEIIENIDIGGPSMVRSAAKNFQDVAIVTSPADYEAIAHEMSASGGGLSLRTKWALAQRAFATTAAYDSAIAGALERINMGEDGEKFDISQIGGSTGFPESLRLSYRKSYDLRYGENPHQKAALYSDRGDTGIANGKQLQGKELSFNNIVDMQAAWDLSTEFKEPFCAIIKHTNPCGSALGKDLAEAFQRAFECDPVSAFGGVIALNGAVDQATAEAIAGLRHNGQALFIECIVAPGFDQGARERFAKRKDLRLVEIKHTPQKWAMKAVSGGMLVQDNDLHQLDPSSLQVVTERKPTEAEMRDLLFAWKIGKHVKSNAILYAKDLRSVGVGAGQMSRVDSAKIGAQKAVLSLEGSVVASDAFFPFPDGVEEIARAGAKAVIQPGGSKMDPEVIATANRLGMAMVLTGVRHFRH